MNIKFLLFGLIITFSFNAAASEELKRSIIKDSHNKIIQQFIVTSEEVGYSPDNLSMYFIILKDLINEIDFSYWAKRAAGGNASDYAEQNQIELLQFIYKTAFVRTYTYALYKVVNKNNPMAFDDIRFGSFSDNRKIIIDAYFPSNDKFSFTYSNKKGKVLLVNLGSIPIFQYINEKILKLGSLGLSNYIVFNNKSLPDTELWKTRDGSVVARNTTRQEKEVFERMGEKELSYAEMIELGYISKEDYKNVLNKTINKILDNFNNTYPVARKYIDY